MPTPLTPTIPSQIHLPTPLPSPSSTSVFPRKIYHILFVTGNPGLIAYYTSFLTTLHEVLNGSHALQERGVAVAVWGRSLRGFEVDGEERGGKWVGLGGQIEWVREGVEGYVAGLASSSASNWVAREKRAEEEEGDVGEGGRGRGRKETLTPTTTHEIILIGHSVGAYIILSLLSLLSSPTPLFSSSAFPPSPTPPPPATKIKSSILLFPTITHIAHSPSGRILSLLSTLIPKLPSVAEAGMRGIWWVLGRRGVELVVGKVAGMDVGRRGGAGEVTVGFLGRRGSVGGAL